MGYQFVRHLSERSNLGHKIKPRSGTFVISGKRTHARNPIKSKRGERNKRRQQHPVRGQQAPCPAPQGRPYMQGVNSLDAPREGDMVTRRQRCRLEPALAIEALLTESQAAQQVRVQTTPTKPTIRVRGRAPPRRLVLAQGSQPVRCHPLPLRTDASEVSQKHNVSKTLCCARQGNPWGAQSSKVNSTGLPTSATHTYRTSHFFRGAKEHDQLKNRTDTLHMCTISLHKADAPPALPAVGSLAGAAVVLVVRPSAPLPLLPLLVPAGPLLLPLLLALGLPFGLLRLGLPALALAPLGLLALLRPLLAGVSEPSAEAPGLAWVQPRGLRTAGFRCQLGGCVGGNGGRTGELGGRGRGRKEIAGTMEMSFVALSPLYFVPEKGISVLCRYLVPGPGKIETIRSLTE